ncbi:MAG TPA: hypothetical protein VF639_18430 [Hymenobacter sp.]
MTDRHFLHKQKLVEFGGGLVLVAAHGLFEQSTEPRRGVGPENIGEAQGAAGAGIEGDGPGTVAAVGATRVAVSEKAETK